MHKMVVPYSSNVCENSLIQWNVWLHWLPRENVITMSPVLVGRNFSSVDILLTFTLCKCNVMTLLNNLSGTGPWLTSPNQERISVTFWGVGKSWMACRNFLHGWTSVRVISKPANSTSSAAKTNLGGGLRIIPFFPQMSSQLIACQKLSSMVSDHKRASSTHLVLLGISATISSYRLVYPSPEAT